MNPYQILLGFLFAVIISWAAWRAHSLSRSGAIAALVLGAVVFGLGGIGWSVLLLAFFISSSFLSRLFGRRKASLNEKFSKGSERDAGQVFANGGIAGICVLIYIILPVEWRGLAWAAYAGAMASVNADTWATELGVLSRVPPRMITTGKIVERGTSGAISLAGTLAAFGGAFFIALWAVLFWQGDPLGITPSVTLGIWFLRLGAISVAGLVGSLVDSLFGATVQAIFRCPSCQKETERHPYHTCGAETQQIRGLAWMDNDLVNVICSVAGAALAALIL